MRDLLSGLAGGTIIGIRIITGYVNIIMEMTVDGIILLCLIIPLLWNLRICPLN